MRKWFKNWFKKLWKSLEYPNFIEQSIFWANYYTVLNRLREKEKQKEQKCSNCINFEKKEI